MTSPSPTHSDYDDWFLLHRLFYLLTGMVYGNLRWKDGIRTRIPQIHNLVPCRLGDLPHVKDPCVAGKRNSGIPLPRQAVKNPYNTRKNVFLESELTRPSRFMRPVGSSRCYPAVKWKDGI